MPEHLDFAELGEGIGNATAVLRNNAASAGLAAPVLTRDGRTMRDLVVSQGVVHHQAAASLRGEPVPSDARLGEQAQAAADLLEWLDDAMVEVLNALAAAPEGRRAWFFSAAAPVDRQQAARWLCHQATLHALEAMATRLGRLPRPAELWLSPALLRDMLDGPEAAGDDPLVPRLLERLRAG